MKRLAIVAAALLGLALVALAYLVLRSNKMEVWFPRYYRTNDEMRHLQAKLDAVRRMTEVDCVFILLDEPKGPSIPLEVPKDSADINSDMASLRHMQVVRGDPYEPIPMR